MTQEKTQIKTTSKTQARKTMSMTLRLNASTNKTTFRNQKMSIIWSIMNRCMGAKIVNGHNIGYDLHEDDCIGAMINKKIATIIILEFWKFVMDDFFSILSDVENIILIIFVLLHTFEYIFQYASNPITHVSLKNKWFDNTSMIYRSQWIKILHARHIRISIIIQKKKLLA